MAAVLRIIALVLACISTLASAEEAVMRFGAVPQSIVVRTTENITEGGWVWLLNKARESGVSRIYLLVKQDENGFVSKRTGRTLRSGELLVNLPGEAASPGWENSDWLTGMLAAAKSSRIEVFAWWPLFNDALAAEAIPAARYIGPAGEVFVDPATPGVHERQERLIEKLLATYPFDGIALDWIRYNSRPDGSQGMLAERFASATGQPWSLDIMSHPYQRALWDEMRASAIAQWTADLVASHRHRRPQVKWGAFVLPWQFKEVAQSYRHLGAAGLDDLQPMIYWADWNEGPDFTSEVLSRAAFWLKGGTRFRPAFDLNASQADTLKALSNLTPSHLAGVTWYLHDNWGEESFAKLGAIDKAWESAGAPVVTEDEQDLEPPPAPVTRMAQRLEPYRFAPDQSAWALVCLAELYKRKALEDAPPAVPVLALHRFAQAGLEGGANLWVNSTAYVTQLLDFIVSAGFSVVPVSHVDAYMLSEDPTILPARPLAITIDDGSLSILQHFHPLAAARKQPYTISIITSLVRSGDERATMEDYGLKDPILASRDIEALAASGLVEFVSHTDNLHFWGPEDETGDESRPAMTARLWRDQLGRKETHSEWKARIKGDLVRSRLRLAELAASGPAVLTWPYGDQNEEAAALANDAGFGSFLNFGNSAFAFPGLLNRQMQRVAITRADETIPLAMPADAIDQQRWWLAFLKWARVTKSADLIDAALEQLDGTQTGHPEAEMSRAALEALRGHSGAALLRVSLLRKAYPHDAIVHGAIDELVDDYDGMF